MQRISTKNMTLISIMVTLTVVSAYISIPIGPVPFTLQSYFVLLSGMILGSRSGAMVVVVYLVMGLMGLPVFSGGKAGVSILVSPTFGYLVGFVFASFLVGRIIESKSRPSTVTWVLAPLVGLLPIYAFGVAYLYMIYNTVISPLNPISLATAFKMGIYPFLLVDLAKALLAGFSGRAIETALKKSAIH